MKSAILECVLVLTAFAALEESLALPSPFDETA
jgi:hypothetical protein